VAWKVSGTADFNGDARSDIALWNSGTGSVAIWYLNPLGTAISSGAALGGSGAVWKVMGTADFNGDYRGDLLLQNTSTGDVAVWFLNSGGTAIATGAVLGTSGVAWVAMEN
jgi:hypothetical protein